jgi:hypothetical protein
VSNHQRSSSKFESDYGNRGGKITVTNLTEGEETGNFNVKGSEQLQPADEAFQSIKPSASLF